MTGSSIIATGKLIADTVISWSVRPFGLVPQPLESAFHDSDRVGLASEATLHGSDRSALASEAALHVV